MPWTPSANNQTEIVAEIVREHFLVRIGFSTSLYLSSRGDITFDSQAYTGANMELELIVGGRGGTLSFYDENFAVIGSLISEGAAGIPVDVWALYGDAPFAAADDDLIFSGELDDWGMNDAGISIRLTEPEEIFVPNITINQANGFNHLPIPGTRFNTPNGVIVLGEAK